MENVIRQSVLLGLLIVGVSGCAAVAPLTSSLTGLSPGSSLDVRSQTITRLQEANFVLVRTNLVGTSKGFKLLGFITFKPATLNEAMNQLYAQANAEEGKPQTLSNLMVEHTGIYVILFSLPRVTARADLIEYIPTQEDDSQPSNELGIQRLKHRF